MSLTEQQTEGYIALAISIIFFGSIGACLKTPALRRANPHPIVFQAYYGFFVGALCLLVLSFEDFHYTPWGILAAFMWAVTQILIYLILLDIPFSIGVAIWNGVTVIVAFFIGYLGFHNKLTNTGLTFVGLVLLVVGIVGIATIPEYFQSKRQKKTSYKEFTDTVTGNVWDPSSNDIENVEQQNVESKYDNNETSKTNTIGEQLLHENEKMESQNPQNKPRSTIGSFDVSSPPTLPKPKDENYKLRYARGVAYAILMGVINGALQVPLQEFSDEFHLASNDPKNASYLATFAVGNFIVSPAMVITLLIYSRFVSHEPVKFQVKELIPSAVLAAVVWTIGYVGATYSTVFLDQAIGYPLTQAGILIGGLWGIFYFKELSGCYPLTSFFFMAVVILGGVFTLSFFGRDPNA